MTLETVLALSLFAFVSSITPGPNNMMLLASGVNFGFKRTIPHILGVSLGFFVLMVAVGLGLGAVFQASPMLFAVIKWGGVAYLLYLAWRIANASAPGGDHSAAPNRGVFHDTTRDAAQSAQPLSFLGACAFQWVNVKAVMMAVTAYSTYVPAGRLMDTLAAAALFTLINMPCVSSWTLLGATLRDYLNKPKVLRIFNWLMAGLLVLSLVPMI